jgi:RNA polymerase sigma factor (sigma-70 family)
MDPVIAKRTIPEDSSIDALYRSLWAPLVRMAWMMCRSRDDAEDIVHDAFVRLASTDRVWPENPHAYLRKIVVNLVRDQRRRRLVVLRHAATPADPVLAVEESGLWEKVQGLPLRQRQALVLRYFDDLSLAEIGELLECPVSAVKSLIHRGLETLRQQGDDRWTT